MPRGSHHHLDPATGDVLAVERFTCAPGAAGWRWVSEVYAADGTTLTGALDVTVDGAWRPVRVVASAYGWTLRGGAAGAELVWVRAAADAPDGPERTARAVGFTGRSPAWTVLSAQRLAASGGERARFRLVALTEPLLAPLGVEEVWLRAGESRHPDPDGPLRVTRYDVVDRDTGVRREVHLAGDVVVAATALELVELDSPPSGLAVPRG